MIKNYFKTALRNLQRNKSYAVINIAGLAIGIAACILLFMVISYELSYDKAQPNYSRIQHIVTEDKQPDGSNYTPGVPFPALEAARADFPQITTGAIYASWGSQVTVMGKNATIATGDKFIENTIFFADPQWFKVFEYKWLIGSPAVLDAPNVTALTKTMAAKYFGNWQKAIGQYIKLDNAVTVQVAGILEDVQANSSFPLNVVTSFATMKRQPDLYGYSDEWHNTTSNFQIFMLLPQNENAATINSQLLTSFSKKYYENDGIKKRYNFLQPLSELHFDNRFPGFGDHIIAKSTLWTLALIGLFILIMACINFINLSTAQAVKRSKEIGIRKVLGSNKTKLFWQMMGETALLVFIALALSVIIAFVCLPYIKNVASISESPMLFSIKNIFFIGAAGLVITLLAGFYPALILSHFSPIQVLKNKMTAANMGGISLRRGLVVLQFGISQVLIIGTIVAVMQMNFVHNADLGFNKNAVLILNSTGDSAVHAKYSAFKQNLLQLPGVQSVSFSSDAPSSDNNWSSSFGYDHKKDENFNVSLKFGDEDYLKTFGLQLIAGAAYSKSDTVKDFVMNETLQRKLGIKNAADAIGKEIRVGGDEKPWRKITGVVKDFKTNSLREETKPILLSAWQDKYYVTAVKMRSNNLAQTKDAIEKMWNKYYPEYAETSSFMEDNINDFYKQENQLALLYKIFAGIAIFISCLGLYGLVSFMSVQRTKEVGIRKVLGASAGNIMYLFSKEFTVLIGIAFLIAAPLSWYIMNNWLQNFNAHIAISAGIFIIAIFVSIGIALLTVGYKSFKAAMANPVKSLRSE